MKTTETVCGYPLFRTRRLTVGIAVKPGGVVEIRAPKGMPIDRIQAFVESKSGWIAKTVAKSPAKPPLPDEETQKRLRKLAQAEIPPLVDLWAQRMGVAPSRVRITAARTRYGSCNSKGHLCFSLFLMLSPMEAVEYVVVHELAHLKHLNHSKDFWALVEKHLPDYTERKGKLL